MVGTVTFFCNPCILNGMDKPQPSIWNRIKTAVLPTLTPQQATQELRLLVDGKDDKISLEKVTKLLSAGADKDVKSANGKTILERAVEINNGPIVALLLSKGANPNYGTPLVAAANNNNTQMIRRLINGGVNVNQTKGSLGALYHAIYWVNLEAVDLLIKAGADVNLPTATGNTPLHEALHRLSATNTLQGNMQKNNLKKIIRILYANGADIHSLNDYQETPLGLARKSGDQEIVQLFNPQKKKIG